jgi:hypothetical protein
MTLIAYRWSVVSDGNLMPPFHGKLCPAQVFSGQSAAFWHRATRRLK